MSGERLSRRRLLAPPQPRDQTETTLDIYPDLHIKGARIQMIGVTHRPSTFEANQAFWRERIENADIILLEGLPHILGMTQELDSVAQGMWADRESIPELSRFTSWTHFYNYFQDTARAGAFFYARLEEMAHELGKPVASADPRYNSLRDAPNNIPGVRLGVRNDTLVWHPVEPAESYKTFERGVRVAGYVAGAGSAVLIAKMVLDSLKKSTQEKPRLSRRAFMASIAAGSAGVAYAAQSPGRLLDILDPQTGSYDDRCVAKGVLALAGLGYRNIVVVYGKGHLRNILEAVTDPNQRPATTLTRMFSDTPVLQIHAPESSNTASLTWKEVARITLDK